MDKFAYSNEEGTLRGYINQIAAVGGSLMKNTHTTVVGCIVHAIKHGRITLLSDLDRAMAGGFHRSGFRKYVIAMGPVDWQLSDKKNGQEAGFVWNAKKAADLRARYEADPDGYVTKALEAKWYEVNPDNAFKPVTVLGMVEAAIKRLTSVQGGKNAAHEKNDFRGLEALKGFHSELKKHLTAKSEPSNTDGNSTVIDLVALPATPASVH